MRPRLALLLTLLLAIPCCTQAQTDTWDELMQQLAEEMVEGEDEQEWESQQELLTELHENPIDLNSATRSQLLQLPFLSERSADALVDYRTLHGPLRSLGELRLIRELSLHEREWLGSIGTVDSTEQQATRSDTTWWGRASHELTTRADIPLYNRAGWPGRRGIANRLRYTWQQGRHLDVGLRGETDAGEPMFNRTTPLWDSYGGHVHLRDLGPLRDVILGDYKASFGQGLVMNNGLRFGKLSMGLWRTAGGIRPHRSTDEVNFLRGAAATLAWGRSWELTALYSFRHLDATVAADNTVQTINSSGLHRTDSELRHRGTLGSHATGLHLATSFPLPLPASSPAPSAPTLSFGLTGLYQYYDHQFRQSDQLYRRILPEGYQFGAVGVDYSLRSSRLYLGGETALSPAIATLNKAAWRFSANTQLTAIQRFYSKHYFSPYASAYGENSRVQNESGLTLQLEADHLGPLALRALLDYFYSPWPRYTMSRASTGWEGLLQTTFSPRRGRTLLLRYSVKSKEQNDRRHVSHRLRASYSHSLSPLWTAHLTALLHHYHEGGNSTGFSIAPRADYTSASQRLRLSLLAVVFRTDDYDSRLFLYEPSLLQTFGMQQLYGHGQRLAATLRLRSRNRRWDVQTKVGATHYSDRRAISSGPLRIDSPWKADVQLLLRLRLGHK